MFRDQKISLKKIISEVVLVFGPQNSYFILATNLKYIDDVTFERSNFKGFFNTFQ